MALEVTIRTITSWYDGRTLWEGEASSDREMVEKAVASGANLSYAKLSGAKLSYANLSDANLSYAKLSGAKLSYANLSDANLSDAKLSDANLSYANLSYAKLSGAKLSGANLSGANLSGANLSYANLSGAKNLRLPTGETWEEYLTVTVPALLTAGGKSLESFGEHFQCHTWDNCPMAHAFSCQGLDGVPVLLRPRAEQFIQFFDSKQIPWPLPTVESLAEK